MTLYSADFSVKGLDKRDNHIYATFSVDFYDYQPAESKPYKSHGNSFVISANNSYTMAFRFGIFVYGDFSEGVRCQLYHNQEKIASFDTYDRIITNIN